MNTQLTSLLITIALVAFSKAATTYHEAVLSRFGGPGFIDLNQDGVFDVTVTFPMNLSGPEGPYNIAPLDSNLIATTSGGIAESLSIGDLLDLSILSFVDQNESVFGGGFIYSITGNYFGEGWGFVIDMDGNPILPPEHFVDLFVVDLNSGVAWVDFVPPESATDFNRVVRWGFSTSDSPLVITSVPEPSVTLTTLVLAVTGYALKRKRRTSPSRRCR